MNESIDRAAIKARIRDCATYNFGMRNADRLAHVDAPALLAALEEAERERDEWKRKFGECHPIHLDGVTRAYAAERRIAAVEALHRPRTIQVLTGDCAAWSCDHEEIDDCPLTPFEQCVECDRIADEVSSYYSEGGVSVSAWPCPTAAALHPVAETTEKGGE